MTRKYALLLTSLVLVFFLAEVSLRFLAPQKTYSEMLRRSSPIYIKDDILIKQLAPIQKLEGSGELRQATSVVIDHVPTIGATIDERYFLYDSSVKPFLMEIMKPMESPVHYRTITNRFNEQVKPLSRKGAGYILDTLNNCPGCTRVDRGIYTLMNST